MNRTLHSDTLSLRPFHKEFKSCLSELAGLRSFIATTLENFLLAKAIKDDVTIAIDEAFTNIIKHGTEDCEEQVIKLGLIIEGDSLRISLIDRGKTFDINSHPELNLKEHVCSYHKGGLGIHLIRQFVDEIKYNPSTIQNGENELLLIKKLHKQS